MSISKKNVSKMKKIISNANKSARFSEKNKAAKSLNAIFSTQITQMIRIYADIL